MKNRESLILLALALVIGILIGVMGTLWSTRSSTPLSRPGPAPASAPAPAVNYQENIRVLEGVVSKEPANRNAWVQLGHNFFDSNQPIKAIEAYDKALELDDQDPNILTDQGVMFRRLGWYDRAIGNFEKASKVDPRHQQSLFNLGIVYRYDLQDFPKAIEIWERFLALGPTGQSAAQVSKEMEFMKAHPGGPTGGQAPPANK